MYKVARNKLIYRHKLLDLEGEEVKAEIPETYKVNLRKVLSDIQNLTNGHALYIVEFSHIFWIACVRFVNENGQNYPTPLVNTEISLSYQFLGSYII